MCGFGRRRRSSKQVFGINHGAFFSRKREQISPGRGTIFFSRSQIIADFYFYRACCTVRLNVAQEYSCDVSSV